MKFSFNTRRQDIQLMPERTFAAKLNEVKTLCTDEVFDRMLLHSSRTKALRLLRDVVIRMNLSYIEANHTVTLIWCSLSTIQYFHYNINAKECALEIPKKKMKFLNRAFDTLSMLVKKLSDFSKTIDATVITYLTDASLWSTQYLCANIIKRLMINSQKSIIAISTIFDALEKCHLENEQEGRLMVRVLCRVLDDYNWVDFSKEIINTILTMFYRSVKVNDEWREKYQPLRRGLEICIKLIIKNVPNDHILMIIDLVMDWVLESGQDEPLYDFGTILQFASEKHKINVYYDSLDNKLFNNIIRLIESSNSVCSLLGHKMFQNLIDRHNNVSIFSSPKIFFIDLQYKVDVPKVQFEDKSFLKQYREALHNSFMACIKQHGKHRGIVETLYTSLCLIVVEVKCGFTVASVVCLVMNIQEYVLTEFTDKLECAHRLHALVISVTSLICWVHDAKVFYEYVNGIMRRRAYEAPFLNPPFKYRYQYAEHHVLWNKTGLFFEDWQVRYGIWKCFRRRKYVCPVDRPIVLGLDQLMSVTSYTAVT